MDEDAEVIRARNPQGLLEPAVRALMERALESHKLIKDVQAALCELAEQLQREDLALFLGYEGAEWTGMALAQWSGSAFNPGCVVIHFYNEGTKPTRDGLMQAVVEYARQGGHDCLIAMDGNDSPKAFARFFSAMGKPTFHGEIVVFDMNEGLL